MKLEFSFGDQIKEVEEHPLSFERLCDIVQSSFGECLPQEWTLQHLDSSFGFINLINEKYYQEFLGEKIREES